MKPIKTHKGPAVEAVTAILGITFITGCVERRVEYVPVYHYQSGVPAQPAPPGAQPPIAASPETNVPPAIAEAPLAPPPLQTEVVPVSPGPDYYWVPGYWYWRGPGWIWIGGRWSHRPWHGAIWVGGGWSRGRGGWHWHGGHWR